MDSEQCEICAICGKQDAAYIGDGDFLCQSTREVYSAW